MHQVSIKDFANINLGDKRRNERFVTIINNISRQPGGSIPKYNDSWYEVKATYNFLKNADITISELQRQLNIVVAVR